MVFDSSSPCKNVSQAAECMLALCQWCGNATFAHIWWYCPVIEKFWRQIQGEIQDMLGVGIPFTLECFRLYQFQGIKGGVRNAYLLANLFTTALTC